MKTKLHEAIVFSPPLLCACFSSFPSLLLLLSLCNISFFHSPSLLPRSASVLLLISFSSIFLPCVSSLLTKSTGKKKKKKLSQGSRAGLHLRALSRATSQSTSAAQFPPARPLSLSSFLAREPCIVHGIKMEEKKKCIEKQMQDRRT